jgi:hypothetical protein
MKGIQSPQISALDLYKEMRRELDPGPIVETAVADCGVATREDARLAFDAFLQWFAALATQGEHGGGLVMKKGAIDAIWHAYILNTHLYHDLCEYVGHFVHHTPRVGSPPVERVRATLALLRREFPQTLNAEFARWDQ